MQQTQSAVAPRFLTKSERERLKAESEKAIEEARLEEEAKLAANRKDFFTREARAQLEERKKRQLELDTERRRRDEEKRRREEEDKRRQENEARGKEPKKRKTVAVTVDDLVLDAALPEEERKKREEEREREQIRAHYLGSRREKKKVQKPSEKFRNIFQFDWDTCDDTTRGDLNPLYHKRHEPQLLFGRGFRAGVDVREQRRRNMFYDALAKKRRERLQALEAQGNTPEEANRILEAFGVTNLTNEMGEVIDFEKFNASLPDHDNDEVVGHWSTKPSALMTDRDWKILREDFSIFIKGGRVPKPLRTWQESGLPGEILEAVRIAGYDKPTPIQMQAIPVALEMRDLIGIAETGSGKTAAFVLPMLGYIKALPRLNDESSQSGPYGLVLAPSRELAIQIREETEKFASALAIKSVAIVGGRSAGVQAFELRRGAEVVIGTPGRVKDCLEKAYTVLIQCNYVVLDEADRMIDLGFEEIVNWILDQIPSSNMKTDRLDKVEEEELAAKAGYRRYRVTQMFSATMPTSVERLARRYLRHPAVICIGHPGGGKQSIEQRLEFISEAKKRNRLVEILEQSDPRVIIFVNQKKNADVIAKGLYKQGFRAVALHGGKAQNTREASLELFKSGDQDILVATDVAGRGIDVEDVQLVINYDMPKEIEAYTHRIGRTGRAGKKGLAISFVTEEDSILFYDLKQLLLSTNNIVPMEITNHPASKQKPGTTTTTAQGNPAVPSARA